MSNFKLNTLTKDEIRTKAPVVFADKPTNSVSDRYVFLSTETILDDMVSLGWLPTQVSQRTQKNDKASRFSPHMLKFSNPDVVIEGEGGDISYPQIIIQNRHDGLGSFKFMAGLYRLVCSNGLVIATAQFENLRIAHKGYTMEELRSVVKTRTEELPSEVQVLNQMKEKKLKAGEKRKLALDGLLLRAGIDPTTTSAQEFEYTPEELKSILSPTRPEDNTNDLWATYNVVQEKMVNGSWNRSSGRQLKRISSFERDLQFNRKLFNQAVELL